MRHERRSHGVDTTAIQSQGEGDEYVVESKGKWKYRPHPTPAQAAEIEAASAGNAARDEDIRRRAYEI